MLLIFPPPPGTNHCRALMSDSLIEDMLEILDGTSPPVSVTAWGRITWCHPYCPSVFNLPKTLQISSSQDNCLRMAVQAEYSPNHHGLKRRQKRKTSWNGCLSMLHIFYLVLLYAKSNYIYVNTVSTWLVIKPRRRGRFTQGHLMPPQVMFSLNQHNQNKNNY